jgi:hypothetical protein
LLVRRLLRKGVCGGFSYFISDAWSSAKEELEKEEEEKILV